MPLRSSTALLACAAACVLAITPADAAPRPGTPASQAPSIGAEEDFLALVRLVFDQIPPASARRALLVDFASLEAASVLFTGGPVERSRIVEAVGGGARELPKGGLGAAGILRGAERSAHGVRVEGLVNLMGSAEATVRIESAVAEGSAPGGFDFRVIRIELDRTARGWEKRRSFVILES